ncbi:MAG: hypothetical protein IPG60_11005 [Bacteroidetes bacterium]|nr:hypothetical protein [Bacteroidota bacterium]MBP7400439.1 hypothetical protein [Chitinophagales bacterium]MBK7109491.1 hypothetical protein [Bacteroidota bacterium]MBK8487771.1 hypothetical protein [Bacteroidota bacterium]MBK8682474.1 hypothetical protein [Bacteroidota bacterium]
MKKITFTFLLFTIACVFAKNANAQDCTTAFNDALNYYYAGQFDYIYPTLANCLENEREYLIKNEDLTFKIYKLLMQSYSNINMDEESDRMFNDLESLLGGKTGYSSKDLYKRLSEIRY